MGHALGGALAKFERDLVHEGTMARPGRAPGNRGSQGRRPTKDDSVQQLDDRCVEMTRSATTTRPWSSDLEDRLWTRSRGRSRFGLPKPSSLATPGRPLNAEQLRRLRAEWLGLRVDLFDYAGNHRSQRGFAVRRACTLDDLATLICAAFGRDDTDAPLPL